MGLSSTSWNLWSCLEYPWGEESRDNVSKVEAKVGKWVVELQDIPEVSEGHLHPHLAAAAWLSAVHRDFVSHLAALIKLMPCPSLKSCSSCGLSAFVTTTSLSCPLVLMEAEHWWMDRYFIHPQRIIESSAVIIRMIYIYTWKVLQLTSKVIKGTFISEMHRLNLFYNFTCRIFNDSSTATSYFVAWLSPSDLYCSLHFKAFKHFEMQTFSAITLTPHPLLLLFVCL